MTGHEHEHCGTCGRSTAACPECAQEWPDGVVGYLDSGGWHNGHKPAASKTRPPEVVKAEKVLDKRQAQYDQARADWEAAASQHYTARHRSTSEAVTIIDNNGAMREIGPIDPAEIRQLADAEASAKTVMDQAGEELVQARMEHRAASGVARV